LMLVVVVSKGVLSDLDILGKIIDKRGRPEYLAAI